MKVNESAVVTIKDQIRGMYYENGTLYMTIPYIHAIITYDLQTKRTNVLGYIDPENNVFEKILKFREKIYLLPANGKGIYYYDMKREEYKKLFILDSVKDEVDFSTRKYFEIFEYRQLIYAVCRNPNAVIIINPFDDAVQIHSLSERQLVSDPRVMEHFPVCICDNKLIYAYSSDIAIEFSLIDKEFKIAYLQEEKDQNNAEYKYVMYGMLLGDAGDKWLYNLYGDLFRVVNNKKDRVEIPKELAGAYDDGYNAEQYKISQVLLVKDTLCFISQVDHRILLYDTRKNMFNWHENPYARWKKGRRKIAYTVSAQIAPNSYLLYHYNNSAIYVWNILEGFIDKMKVEISVGKIISAAAFSDCVLHYFQREDDLELYLAYIRKTRKYKKDPERKKCGKNIYQSIKG